MGNDRIAVTHVGSLARPVELQAFIRAQENGDDYDHAAFEACLRDSVAEVVRQQADVGIDVVSDGEFGKTFTWAWYIRDRLDGFEERPFEPTGEIGPQDPSRQGQDRRDYAEFYADYFRRNPIASGVRDRGQAVCVGPIRYAGQDAIARDIADLKAGMDAAGRHRGLPAGRRAVERGADPRRRALRQRRGVHLRARRRAQRGVPGDRRRRPEPAGRRRVPGDDVRHDGPARVDGRVPRVGGAARRGAQPRARGHPAGARRATTCAGAAGTGRTPTTSRCATSSTSSCRSASAATRSSRPTRATSTSGRCGETSSCREDRVLLPGLISHSTNVLEHPELVAQRIVRLAELVGRERVIASTDCGFAQTPYLSRVHPQIMWAKLQALSDGAAIASAKLWP